MSRREHRHSRAGGNPAMVPILGSRLRGHDVKGRGVIVSKF
jgi:hypothetical protein